MSTSFEAPNAEEVLARYREHAPGYDASAQRTMGIRRQAIAALDLRPGDRVLDIACGTGLSFAGILDGVGSEGQVIGIELSPEMSKLARQRVTKAGWNNVTLIESAVESADIPGPVDAILFHYTHDVLRSPLALPRIFAAARPGARVAFAGMKYAPWWAAPLNLIVRAQARPYMSTFEGLSAPWSLALPYMSDFRWCPVLFGTGYVGAAFARPSCE